METSEGPPNQPWREVFAEVSAEMDARVAEFLKKLGPAMTRFDELAP